MIDFIQEILTFFLKSRFYTQSEKVFDKLAWYFKQYASNDEVNKLFLLVCKQGHQSSVEAFLKPK